MTEFKRYKFAVLAGFASISAATASAGEWVLNPARCPDLIEDRLDQRVVTGPADLREDIRDLRRVECPASAWTYRPSQREKPAATVRVYAGPRAVFVRRHGDYSFAPAKQGKARRASAIHIHIG